MSDVADRMAPYLGSEYLGLASQEREIRCPSCARQTPIRVVYFADIEQCTAYVEAVRSEWVGRSQCQHCRKCIPIRSPVIVECPTRNLLIFVTHHGDDGEVEKGFKQWLDYVRMVLPRDAFSRVSKRPYAFVHGSVGLLALLSALDGDGFSTSPSPYPHREDDNGIAFGMLVGYSFGRLHFYHPAHRAVQPVVHLLRAR